jgi:hypothetical protein
MHPVETYLSHLARIRSTGGGVAETSYYGALEGLLNEIGGKLKPRVRCVPQLKNTGAGSPDFGLYTAHQFQRAKDEEPVPGVLPERGVIEVKAWSDDSFVRAKGSQVSKYWDKYCLVLATNYRDFVLVGRDEAGKPVRLEAYCMAESEPAFLEILAHGRKAADDQGDRLVEFLSRVMLHAAVLTSPQALAWFLASYAREARYRVEKASSLPALAGLKKSLEEALGMEFEGEKGEHFFRATLVQTLFYGVFSSWVLWARNHPAPGERFNWHAAGWTLHVPMIKSLFDQIATPTRLKPLGVDEVLDWAGAVLDRVDRGAFFQKFEEEHAVQYFYEPFLNAYDPDLRKELGVWYTPPEIVQYQVERVDRVLREELDIADGLADDNVVILDPCCGTGAYLVETLKRIHKTLEEKGGSALTAQKLKKAAIERVFGFELLPAPFVVSHLQLGLMLRLLGAPLDANTDERAGVYLTNALTGWEPPKDPKTRIADEAARELENSKGVREAEQFVHAGLPELVEEVAAARAVKRDKRILVILGNPPYNAFAGTSPAEEGGLVEPYKESLTTPTARGGWSIKKFNLDDLYVRFFRIAERRIAKTGKGVVSYISNFSYLDDPSFVVMRMRFLDEFDKLWFDCMNGDSRETGKVTPDGRPDPSVFSTEHNKAGIRVGTAICVMVRKGIREKKPTVRFQNYWGANKRQDVLDNLRFKNLDRRYDKARPSRANRYSFRPSKVSAAYMSWPPTPCISCEPPLNGPIERRGNSLIVLPAERDKLRPLIAYLDETVSDEEMTRRAPAFMKSSGEFDATKSRTLLKGRVKFDEQRIVPYPFKPFDVRLAYLDAEIAPLFSRPSPQLLDYARIEDNKYFVTRDTADKYPEGPPFFFSPRICDYDSLSGHARHFPILIRHGCEVPRDVLNGQSVFEQAEPYCVTKANLSDTARAYLARLGVGDPDRDAETAAIVWMHALAIGYAPASLSENADGIRQDWPRIPLPATKKALLHSAELGRRVAALLDTEKPVDGVTRGKIDPRLKPIAVVSKQGGGPLDPLQGHLDLTAGWGHCGRDGGVCMPGRGKIEVRAQKDKTLRDAFGNNTLDVYLNEVGFWANVPEAVWDYYIGGYQVIKKWLSYREKPLLGRGLRLDEADYVTDMACRIAALILLQPQLDASYQAVKADTWPWPL